jgi:hypothetical protein
VLSAILYLLPALLLVVPLLLGRYLGEEKLAEIRARIEAPRRRAPGSIPAPRARRHAPAAHGGRLIALRLAERAPPLASLT